MGQCGVSSWRTDARTPPLSPPLSASQAPAPAACSGCRSLWPFELENKITLLNYILNQMMSYSRVPLIQLIRICSD